MGRGRRLSFDGRVTLAASNAEMGGRKESTMGIDLGARVETADGKSAGLIKYIILDSRTADARAMVVEKGLLFHDDREVRLDDVRSAEGDHVVLKLSEDE